MISDCTLFHANFERLFLDYHHMSMRVLDAQGSNISVSTLVFNTALLVNERLVDPTQGNMRWLRKQCSSDPPLLEPFRQAYHPNQPQVFQLGEQVHMYQGFSTHLHHADLALIEGRGGGDLGARALTYWWEDFQLPDYVSAICKLSQGGSLYLGMRPEDPTVGESEREQLEALEGGSDDDSDSDGEIRAKIRRRSSPSSSDSDSSPPRRRRRLSLLTKFFCEGLELTQAERSSFEGELQRRVEGEMLWHPHYPRDEGPVASVHFHAVGGGGPDLCLPEIQVKRFTGFAFQNLAGPEAFRAVGHGKSSVVERIPFKEYIDMFDLNSRY